MLEYCYLYKYSQQIELHMHYTVLLLAIWETVTTEHSNFSALHSKSLGYLSLSELNIQNIQTYPNLNVM